ncbi:hypothetical protein M9458_034284, partial [Cirrhinus mrigala]
ACDLTLDLNTVNSHLALSEKNKKMTYVEENQPYPDCAERFDESLTGRCYWEAEWSGRGVYVSVAYKGIGRKGCRNNCWFGYNEKVGVYLNWSAGTLSFYSVSDKHTLIHLHTFNTTFTEPLYAGFMLVWKSSV